MYLPAANRPKSTVKAEVYTNSTIGYRCPGCSARTEAPLTNLGFRFRIIVTCLCQTTFVVEINLREVLRKKVNIPAHFTLTRSAYLEMAAQNSPPESRISPRPNGRIIDLSRRGIGLLDTESSHVEKGELIRLTFRLDHQPELEITQDYRVVNITNNRLGCSMVGENPMLAEIYP